MPEWSQLHDDQSTDPSLSRRRLLTSGAATAATLVVGATGTAAATQETGRFNDAPGRGGQAVTAATEFREQPFHIVERTGDTAAEIDGALFSCNEGDGEQIFLVGWLYQYVDDDTERLLFTRSNNIDTDKTYAWSTQGAKQCDDSGIVLSGDGVPEDFVQTGYKATGPQ